MATNAGRAALITAATLIGVGMGGFVDGILFHQVFQLHGMLSERLPRVTLVNVEVNMFWDGLFHVFTWLMTALGVALLWRATGRADVPHSTRTFVGGLSLGWGLFNFIEGVVDHQVLGLHHVVDAGRHQMFWDMTFLASGALLILVGVLLIEMPRVFHAPTPSHGHPRMA